MDNHKVEPIDKSTWGDGPWQTEPDRAEWEHAGLPCLAVRHESSGHWCGYAAVPPGHPLHGKGYDDVDVDAHGGLTYASACSGHVCHVPKPGEPDDVWWFGFDCAHAGDYTRIAFAYRALFGRPEKPYDHDEAIRLQAQSWSAAEVYRTLDYVREQANALAEQLAAKA